MFNYNASRRASQIALKSLFGFFILILVGAFSLMILPALAWTEPSAAPPGNNVYAPVNLGPTFQTKSAGLGVQTLPGTTGVGLLVGQGDIVLGSSENIIYGNAKSTSTGSLLKLENCTDAGTYPIVCTGAQNALKVNAAGLTTVGNGSLSLGSGFSLITGILNQGTPSTSNFLYFKKCNGEVCPSPDYTAKITYDGSFVSYGGGIYLGGDQPPYAFTVEPSTGNLTKINSVAYSWPADQASGTKCLVNDGTGALTWGACATGGSGTPGGSNTQVQFNDSGSFNGDSALVIDKTNHRVGIGMATPGYRLHVPWLTGDAVATAYFGSGNASNNQVAVYGQSYGGDGVYGVSTSGYGVYGTSTDSTGVYGVSTNSTGVLGVSTSSYGVYGLTTSGIGVHGMSTDGIGVSGSSTNSYAGYFDINPAATNTVAEILRLQRSVSGTAANGIGGSMDWYLEDSVGTAELSGRISNLLTTATSGSETSALTFWTRTGGAAIAERVRIDGAGKVGIGETAPGYPLDIKNSGSTGTAEIRLNQNNATALWTGLALARQSAEKWYIGMDNTGAGDPLNSDNLLFRRNGTTNDLSINGTDGTVTVAGQIKIAGGSPGTDKVLTSDANGLATWQTPAASSGGSPVGSIVMYGAADPPTGWLLCDGRSYPIITYPDLFAVIGYTYGGGGPSFFVPNLQEKFPKGYFSGGINQLGDTGGQTSATPTFTGNALGTHQHAAITAGTPAGTNSIPIFTGTLGTTAAANTGATAYGTTASTVTLKAHTHTITPAGTVSAPTFTGSPLAAHQHAAISAGTPSGSVSAISTEPPYIVINFIIKY